MPLLQTVSCNCLSWNPAFDEPQMLIVGGQSDDAPIQLYSKKDGAHSFGLYSNKFRGGHTHRVNDIAFAPLMGRSFHMVASCSKDAIVVWKLVVRDIFGPENECLREPVIEQLFRVADAHSECWRLSWNLLGTCFASAGDDSAVKIWKRASGPPQAGQKGFYQLACLQAKQ